MSRKGVTDLPHVERSTPALWQEGKVGNVRDMRPVIADFFSRRGRIMHTLPDVGTAHVQSSSEDLVQLRLENLRLRNRAVELALAIQALQERIARHA
jgi:hypothetical protein